MSTPLLPGDEVVMGPYAQWAFGIYGHRRVDGYRARVARIGPPMTACGLSPLVVLTCPDIPDLPAWTVMAASREELSAVLDRARWMTARRVWASVRRAWEASHAARELAVAVATVAGLALGLVVIAWQALAPAGLGPAEALLAGLVLAAVAAACRWARRRRGAR